MSAVGVGGGGGSDTVGSLLAGIATSLSEALRAFMFADKRQWGPDEFEQIRALEEALDDAKKDFQEMGPLVNGQIYYENDRRVESIEELRALHTNFDFHAQNFRDWIRTGGPINPIWARETAGLQRELHRAQCRAARRIFAGTHQESGRCLGAFLVYRRQRQHEAERQQRERDRQELPLWQQQHHTLEDEAARQRGEATDDPTRRSSLELLVPDCNAIGRFERFGEHDIAFLCDYCDGHIVWEDLTVMPAARSPLAPGDMQPNWQAGGMTHPKEDEPAATKTIVFAPLAIANHLPPERGDWLARLMCPFCDNYTYYDQGEDSEDEVRWSQEDGGFDDLQSFQEHLEWNHTAIPVPALPALPVLPKEANKCVMM
ncbi:hypothetical protein GQ53DRAFT_234925 [Thozetella sp. PMI_491]|nr:hypothetical protein GQ53DRAFT_234925 [Thozetella sp. PMI_491]